MIMLVLHAGSNPGKLFLQLCKLIQDSPVAEVIESIEGSNVDDFSRWYCHDFIRTVHPVTHKQGDMEYKVNDINISVLK